MLRRRRTDTILLKPNVEQENELFRLAEQTSLLWNQANYERRQAFFRHEKIPSYKKQCHTWKHSEHFKAIGTGKAQAILKKLNESWSAFFALKRLQAKGQLPPHITKVNPPKYWKDRETKQTEVKMFCVRSDSYRIKDDDATIILSKDLKVRYSVDRIRKGKKGRLDVLYDKLSNRWYAHIPIELQEEEPQKEIGEEAHQSTGKKKKYGSIDLGICNILTFYSEEEQPIIYSGRSVLSDWRYHTKGIADLQSQLPKKQHTSTRIQKAFRTRQRRFKHAINSMLRDLFERVKEMEITDIIVGDLTGIRDGKDYGRKTNQKLHNFWSHAKTIKRIRELGEEYKIQITEVSERNTSKTCCMCGKQHNGRVKRGLHYCKEAGTVVNADVNGAVNILKVAVYGSLSDLPTDHNNRTIGSSGSRALASPLKLRWEYHQWH